MDSVVISAGETVSFPVPTDHPLAKYQQLHQVSEVANLSDLALVRVLKAANPTASVTSITNFVNGILNSAGIKSICTLNFSDLHVVKGATVVLGGPISALSANNVVIEGTLLVHGSLNLYCTQLSGYQPMNIVKINR